MCPRSWRLKPYLSTALARGLAEDDYRVAVYIGPKLGSGVRDAWAAGP